MMNPLSSSVSSLYGRKACSGLRTEGGPVELPGGVALLFTFPRMNGCADPRCDDDRFSLAGLVVRRRCRRRGPQQLQQPINPKTPRSPLSRWCLLRSKGILPMIRKRPSSSLIPRMKANATYIKPRMSKIADATHAPAAFPTDTCEFHVQ